MNGDGRQKRVPPECGGTGDPRVRVKDGGRASRPGGKQPQAQEPEGRGPIRRQESFVFEPGDSPRQRDLAETDAAKASGRSCSHGISSDPSKNFRPRIRRIRFPPFTTDRCSVPTRQSRVNSFFANRTNFGYLRNPARANRQHARPHGDISATSRALISLEQWSLRPAFQKQGSWVLASHPTRAIDRKSALDVVRF